MRREENTLVLSETVFFLEQIARSPFWGPAAVSPLMLRTWAGSTFSFFSRCLL